ncbi:hypothetical protein Agub_g9480, partial [Astrephomene gubernaculifera]
GSGAGLAEQLSLLGRFECQSAGGLLGGLEWWFPPLSRHSNCNSEDGDGGRAGGSAGGCGTDDCGGGGGGGGGWPRCMERCAVLWVDGRIGAVMPVRTYGSSLAVLHLPAIHPRHTSAEPAALLLQAVEAALAACGVRTLLLALTPAAAHGIAVRQHVPYDNLLLPAERLAAEAAAASTSDSTTAAAAAAGAWLGCLGYTPARGGWLEAADVDVHAVCRIEPPPPPPQQQQQQQEVQPLLGDGDVDTVEREVGTRGGRLLFRGKELPEPPSKDDTNNIQPCLAMPGPNNTTDTAAAAATDGGAACGSRSADGTVAAAGRHGCDSSSVVPALVLSYNMQEEKEEDSPGARALGEHGSGRSIPAMEPPAADVINSDGGGGGGGGDDGAAVGPLLVGTAVTPGGDGNGSGTPVVRDDNDDAGTIESARCDTAIDTRGARLHETVEAGLGHAAAPAGGGGGGGGDETGDGGPASRGGGGAGDTRVGGAPGGHSRDDGDDHSSGACVATASDGPPDGPPDAPAVSGAGARGAVSSLEDRRLPYEADTAPPDTSAVHYNAVTPGVVAVRVAAAAADASRSVTRPERGAAAATAAAAAAVDETGRSPAIAITAGLDNGPAGAADQGVEGVDADCEEEADPLAMCDDEEYLEEYEEEAMQQQDCPDKELLPPPPPPPPPPQQQQQQQEQQESGREGRVVAASDDARSSGSWGSRRGGGGDGAGERRDQLLHIGGEAATRGGCCERVNDPQQQPSAEAASAARRGVRRGSAKDGRQGMRQRGSEDEAVVVGGGEASGGRRAVGPLETATQGRLGDDRQRRLAAWRQRHRELLARDGCPPPGHSDRPPSNADEAHTTAEAPYRRRLHHHQEDAQRSRESQSRHLEQSWWRGDPHHGPDPRLQQYSSPEGSESWRVRRLLVEQQERGQGAVQLEAQDGPGQRTLNTHPHGPQQQQQQQQRQRRSRWDQQHPDSHALDTGRWGDMGGDCVGAHAQLPAVSRQQPSNSTEARHWGSAGRYEPHEGRDGDRAAGAGAGGGGDWGTPHRQPQQQWDTGRPSPRLRPFPAHYNRPYPHPHPHPQLTGQERDRDRQEEDHRGWGGRHDGPSRGHTDTDSCPGHLRSRSRRAPLPESPGRWELDPFGQSLLLEEREQPGVSCPDQRLAVARGGRAGQRHDSQLPLPGRNAGGSGGGWDCGSGGGRHEGPEERRPRASACMANVAALPEDQEREQQQQRLGRFDRKATGPHGGGQSYGLWHGEQPQQRQYDGWFHGGRGGRGSREGPTGSPHCDLQGHWQRHHHHHHQQQQQQGAVQRLPSAGRVQGTDPRVPQRQSHDSGPHENNRPEADGSQDRTAGGLREASDDGVRPRDEGGVSDAEPPSRAPMEGETRAAAPGGAMSPAAGDKDREQRCLPPHLRQPARTGQASGDGSWGGDGDGGGAAGGNLAAAETTVAAVAATAEAVNGTAATAAVAAAVAAAAAAVHPTGSGGSKGNGGGGGKNHAPEARPKGVPKSRPTSSRSIPSSTSKSTSSSSSSLSSSSSSSESPSSSSDPDSDSRSHGSKGHLKTRTRTRTRDSPSARTGPHTSARGRCSRQGRPLSRSPSPSKMRRRRSRTRSGSRSGSQLPGSRSKPRAQPRCQEPNGGTRRHSPGLRPHYRRCGFQLSVCSGAAT